MLRSTCLYCEANGDTTALVFVSHWGYCPIHSAAFLEANRLPTIREQVNLLVPDRVGDRGRPTINGQRV